MLQSQLFSKTSRHVPKDETSFNAQLLIRAGFIDKLMAGVYSYLPLGLRVLKKIENIVREEMEKAGGQEILLPALQPKAHWVTTGRLDTYDTHFRFTSYYSHNDYTLGPTHEEIVSPLAKKVIFSYQDLPRHVFQIQTKFRDEKRAKAGLLRGREFLMKDLYSFHADENDLDQYYEKMQNVYHAVYEKLGIGDITYLTFASGGTFSKYSHEFQTLSEVGEDTIYICEKCKLAVNKEIITEQPNCPSCGGKELQEKTAIEIGNIFKLKTKYSDPFSLVYKDQGGKERAVLMGCYGIGISRLMGVLVEIFHDENGIIWPESIAPAKVHLLALGGVSAFDVYNNLQNKGIEVVYDNRELGAGEKFKDADLMGIPWRLVVSPGTKGKIEIKRRSGKDTKIVDVEEAIRTLLS